MWSLIDTSDPELRVPAARWTRPFALRAADWGSFLAEYERVFRAEWLSQTGDHPLRRLWRSYDDIHGIEVATIGHALAVVAENSARPTVDSFIAELRNSQDGQLSGRVWELLTAGLLTCGGARPALASTKQAGFDLTLRGHHDRSYWISCKSLSDSVAALDVSNWSDSVYSTFRQSCPPGPAVSVVICAHRPLLKQDGRELVKLGRKAALGTLGVSRDFVEFDRGEHTVRIGALAPIHRLPFVGQGRSCLFHYLMPQHQREEQRFVAKLSEADAKFEKAGPRPPNVRTVVAIRVPRTVPVQSAAEHARTYFRHNPATLLDFVYAIRAGLAHGAGAGDTRELVYEWTSVPNPRLKVGDSFPPLVSPSVGQSIAADLEFNLHLEYGKRLSLSNYHVAKRGFLYYLWNEPPDTPFFPPRVPDVHVQITQPIAPGFAVTHLPLRSDAGRPMLL